MQRSRYVNATRTLETLLKAGVVPIVNENDTIAVQEIKFGDNDTLSAITAGMVQADCLFLLTDVDCLYTDNPRKNRSAQQVKVVRDIEALRLQISTATLGSSLGTGGMETKIIAAELATGAGVTTVITNARRPGAILDILQAPEPDFEGPIQLLQPGSAWDVPWHTRFAPTSSPISSRRFWVLYGLAPRGRIIIDQGAYKALFKLPHKKPRSHLDRSTQNQSDVAQKDAEEEEEEDGNGGRLLAAGVVAVEGHFAAGQAVRIAVSKKSTGSGSGDLESSTEDLDGLAKKMETLASEDLVEVGRGLANYNWQEIDRVKRLNR